MICPTCKRHNAPRDVVHSDAGPTCRWCGNLFTGIRARTPPDPHGPDWAPSYDPKPPAPPAGR